MCVLRCVALPWLCSRPLLLHVSQTVSDLVLSSERRLLYEGRLSAAQARALLFASERSDTIRLPLSLSVRPSLCLLVCGSARVVEQRQRMRSTQLLGFLLTPHTGIKSTVQTPREELLSARHVALHCSMRFSIMSTNIDSKAVWRHIKRSQSREIVFAKKESACVCVLHPLCFSLCIRVVKTRTVRAKQSKA